MSKVSYSKVSTFSQCPFLYKLKYIDHLKPIFDEKPDNALHLGTCLHEALESRDIEKAIDLYKSKYQSLDDNNEIEILKLRTILPKALSQIPQGEYEYQINISDEFVGYIDMLVKVDDGVYDLYDFKYATNSKRYESSAQVHLYKYYYEKTTNNKIRNIYYAVIPKCKDTLSTLDKDKLVNKITNSYSKKDVEFINIEYNIGKVYQFLAQKSMLDEAKVFEKVYSTKCAWCQFQKYCRSNGEDTSEIIKKQSIEETSLF